MRGRLTLWYGAVLAATLVVFGLVLYFGLQDLLTRPVVGMLSAAADRTASRWQQSPATCPLLVESRPPEPSGGPPRPPGLPVRRPPLYVACIDPQGRILGAITAAPGTTDRPPDVFLDPSLFHSALRSGRASDMVNGGEETGLIFRVAVAVPNPTGGGVLGVVQVGRSVAAEIGALHLLRDLLFVIGAVAVLVATIGGLFLANRALVPARLALARQQAFIGDASHELRTPLTLIRADAEVLLRHRDRIDPDDAALVGDIVTETEHMDRLTTNLLTLARLDAGRLQLARELVDLSRVAQSAVRRLAPLTRKKAITVHEEYRAGTQVSGDPQALEQVALILVENAVKYTPHGGQVTIRTISSSGQVDLIVEDTGIGIPAEYLGHLGERFYRVDAARSPDGGGAGLGLAIAFGVAAAHGGSVQITSVPNQGTRVILRLAIHTR